MTTDPDRGTRGATADGQLEAALAAFELDPDEGERRLGTLLATEPPAGVAAPARYRLARRRVEQGRPADALHELDLAAAAFDAAGDTTASLRTTLGRMHALDELGRHGEAVATADATLRRIDQLEVGDDELVWLRAAVAENRGVALGYAGRTVEAIEAARQAHRAWSAVGSPADLARAAGNLGVELLDAGLAGDALPALEEAVERFAELDLTVPACVARSQQARALGLLGEPMRALAVLEGAIAGLDAAQAWAERDRARAHRAALLLDLGWWHGLADEADALERAAARDGRRPDVARALLVRAAVLLGSDRHVEAATAADAAATTFTEVGEQRADASARLLQIQAMLADDTADLAHAGQLCEEVLATSDANAWVLHSLRAQLLRGRIELREGRHGHAGASAVEVRRTASRLGLLELEAGAEHVLASAHRAVDEIDQAVDALERAVSLLESARSRLTSGALHAVFLGAADPAHDDLVRLLVDRGVRGDHHRASEVAALRNERTLVELRRARADRSSAPSNSDDRAALLEAHGVLRARLDAGSLPDTGRVTSARETQDLLVQLESLATELRLHDLSDTALEPRTRSAGFGPREATDAAVVDYEFVGDELLAFVHVGPALIVVRGLATRSEVEVWARRVAGHWRRAAQPGLLGNHAAALQQDADRDLRTVARAILDPVLARLPAPRHLAIVPRGPLLSIPFSALPLEDGSNPVRLIDRAAVQTAVVARLPGDLRAQDRPGRTGVLVVGGGEESPPAVRDEMVAVAEALGDEALVLSGQAATASALSRHASLAAVLHLAGHGLHDARHPTLSSIRLADRWVSAAELGGLDLRGADVVLSACDTALRSPEGGDVETAGLVTAILAAGARTATSSLWPVDDAATARLMRTLHTERVRGSAPDRALVTAQLELRRDQPHPYAWAAFTCQVLAATNLGTKRQEAA